jgi:uncharacterized protein (DUF433 family)
MISLEEPEMESTIINRGRGPEIAGTRITVYDIMDYLKEDWHHTAIAATLRISSDQVLAAVQYIKDHEEEIEANYQKLLDRSAKGNPPEIQARLDEIHSKYQELWATRRKTLNAEDDGYPGGQRRPTPSGNPNPHP